MGSVHDVEKSQAQLSDRLTHTSSTAGRKQDWPGAQGHRVTKGRR